MPLRDHFHAPIDDRFYWQQFYCGWPAMIVRSLSKQLPLRYAAGPFISCDDYLEIDTDQESNTVKAPWAPEYPTVSSHAGFLPTDDYEVRVFDNKRGRRLVAAIEIVSPANKDRLEQRGAFVGKCAALLQQQVSVTIIDLVTNRNFNLYAELLKLIGQADPALGPEPPSLYTVACRTTKRGAAWFLETWTHPLALGQPLPTLPLWLADNLAIPLELEESCEETCRALRIP